MEETPVVGIPMMDVAVVDVKVEEALLVEANLPDVDPVEIVPVEWFALAPPLEELAIDDAVEALYSSGPATRPVVRVASLGLPMPEGFDEVIPTTKAPSAVPAVLENGFSFEISNGAGRRHMASRLSGHMHESGLPEAILTNAVSFNFMRSTVFYRPGYEEAASYVASFLPFSIAMQEYNNRYADVRLRLGGDLLDFDKSLLTAMKGQ